MNNIRIDEKDAIASVVESHLKESNKGQQAYDIDFHHFHHPVQRSYGVLAMRREKKRCNVMINIRVPYGKEDCLQHYEETLKKCFKLAIGRCHKIDLDFICQHCPNLDSLRLYNFQFNQPNNINKPNTFIVPIKELQLDDCKISKSYLSEVSLGCHT